jgi:hypothetical protein
LALDFELYGFGWHVSLDPSGAKAPSSIRSACCTG